MRPPFSPGKNLPTPQFNLLPWLLVLLAALVVIPRCLLIVQPGYEAVVFNRLVGTEMAPRREGIHILIPVLQFPVLYDVRTQTYNMTSQSEERSMRVADSLAALTADGQRVDLDISVRYRINPERVAVLHQAVGPDYLNKIIRPASQAVVRNVIARFSAIGVYSGQRAEIQDQIQAELAGLMADEGLLLQSLLLRNVEFSREFQSAIEAKQIAEQEKQREVYRVEQAKLIAQRVIVKAEGEAQSIRLKGEALQKNPDVIQLEYVRNLPDGVKTVVSDQNTILNFGDFLQDSTR
ncbi:prohibitin family protein [Synechococcus sp. PCC 7336]|uniref:prohibitin family protein n=1 Tax=Synechococcus sp. PCC 7336 TaxID=195250 RepID=UPI0003478909|nr:prohibitin family protein [Synechococcus sp. PCC 7336]